MAIFPSAVSTDSDLFIAKNGLGTLLSSSIDDLVTTIPVTSTTGFPTVGYIVIDSEVIKYTSTNATNFLSCTRASDGTSASSHTTGAAVKANAVADHHNALKDEIKAIEQNISDRLGLHATDVILQANLNANSKKISSLAAATTNGDAVRYEQVNGLFLPLTGGLLTGNLGLPVGAVATPSIYFTGDTNTGIYHFAADNLNFSCGGTDIASMSTTEFQSIVQFRIINGTVSSPGINFGNDADTGIYLSGTNELSIGTNGTRALTISATQAVKIKGTSTNNDATAGDYGEYISSAVGTSNAAASNTYDDGTSISLTAGDWDVSAEMMWELNGATGTEVDLGISITSGNSATGLTSGTNYAWDYFASSSSTQGRTLVLPLYRMSLSSTTTVYLKRRFVYSAGTPRQVGSILRARRVR